MIMSVCHLRLTYNSYLGWHLDVFLLHTSDSFIVHTNCIPYTFFLPRSTRFITWPAQHHLHTIRCVSISLVVLVTLFCLAISVFKPSTFHLSRCMATMTTVLYVSSCNVANCTPHLFISVQPSKDYKDIYHRNPQYAWPRKAAWCKDVTF